MSPRCVFGRMQASDTIDADGTKLTTDESVQYNGLASRERMKNTLTSIVPRWASNVHGLGG